VKAADPEIKRNPTRLTGERNELRPGIVIFSFQTRIDSVLKLLIAANHQKSDCLRQRFLLVPGKSVKPFQMVNIPISMFEVVLSKRGRTRWDWRVNDSTGKIIMRGWENSRPAARYQGARALFLLLMAAARIDGPPQTTQGPQAGRQIDPR